MGNTPILLYNITLEAQIVIPPIAKIIVRPIMHGLDALLEQLYHQIANDQKEQAMATVSELRAALEQINQYLK